MIQHHRKAKNLMKFGYLLIQKSI